MLRTAQVRLPAHQVALHGPLLDVLEVRHAVLCHHDRRLFGHTLAHPQLLCITSGPMMLDVQSRLLRPCYVSRAQDISAYFCDLACWSEKITPSPPRIDVRPRTDLPWTSASLGWSFE